MASEEDRQKNGGEWHAQVVETASVRRSHPSVSSVFVRIFCFARGASAEKGGLRRVAAVIYSVAV